MVLEVLEREAGYAVVACGRVVLLVWRGASSAQGIDRVHALLRARAAAQPGPAVLLSVVAPQASRPPDEASREAIRRAVRAPAPGLAGVGTVQEAGGFRGAFVRALVSGLQRMQVGDVPMRVFGSAAEAAPWAAELVGQPVTAEALAEAIRAGREG